MVESLHQLGIPYAVVGGMALFAHGVRRFTEDVDILLTPEGLAETHRQLDGLGYTPPFKGSKQLRDAETGETIISGTIYIKEASQAAETNNYGFYSVSVTPGIYTVIYSYVGYTPITQKVDLTTNQSFNAEMHSATTMKEFKVTGGRKDENVKNAEMGTITLSMAQMKTLPVLFGEVDLMKTLQLLPGVQSAGEGNSGIYVRGGGPDQNLVLLDDAVVYNTGHLFGFFSIFNSDAIKDCII